MPAVLLAARATEAATTTASMVPMAAASIDRSPWAWMEASTVRART